MSVTVAANYAGTYSKTWNVTSSADGDTAGTVSHGFAAAPVLVWLVPLTSNAYLHQWTLGVISATTILLGATSSTGAGLAGTPQLAVVAMLPHSMIA